MDAKVNAMLHSMRVIIGTIAIVFAFVTATAAAPASWQITAAVDYPTARAVSPAGAKATVRIKVDDDATAIEVEVYGVDGMRVEEDNKVIVRRDRLARGASFAFDITIHPGPGQPALVVSAKARFAGGGSGATVRNFPFGK
jgi:hypothetical protein